MKIRVINANDWEKIYEFDKSIIRVGSQLSCDIQLRDNGIQPIHLQFNRTGNMDVRYTMRIFAENVLITRGGQTFTGQQMSPYEILDGDKLNLGSYRLILTLEDEKTRVRKSQHMEAKMYMQKREISPDSPINGTLKLTNTGTEKACQFRLHITGIPDECLRSSPLPYLYPGGVSTVGFTISHLQTKPAPGFHTVSISLMAPEEYFGEVLEFNQDIYVVPVFKNELILEDDSAELSGFNNSLQAPGKEEPKPAEPVISDAVRETARMIPGQEVNEEPVPEKQEAPVILSSDMSKNAFSDDTADEEENDENDRRRRKKEKVVVIHHDDQMDDKAFEDPGPSASDSDQETDNRPEKSGEASLSEKPAEAAAEEKPVEKTVRRRKPKAVPAPEQPAETPENERENTEPEENMPEMNMTAVPEKPSKPKRKQKNAAASEPEKPNAAEKNISAEEADTTAAEAAIESPGIASVPFVMNEVSASVTAASPDTLLEEKAGKFAEPASETAEAPSAAVQPIGEEGGIGDVTEPSAEDTPEPGAVTAADDEPVPVPEISEKPGAGQEDSGSEAVPEAVKEYRDETGEEEKQKEDQVPETEHVIDVPVVHGRNAFGFDDEDEEPAAPEEKTQPIRFVKRGSFDD